MVKSAASAIAKSLRCFFGDERGTSAIEYALIASGVSIVIVGTIAAIGTEVKGLYTSVNTALK